jgi:hypothetical protein
MPVIIRPRPKDSFVQSTLRPFGLIVLAAESVPASAAFAFVAAAYSLRKAGRHPRGTPVARLCGHLLEFSIDLAADERMGSFIHCPFGISRRLLFRLRLVGRKAV